MKNARCESMAARWWLRRLTGSGGKARLHLLNYAGANRKVDGIRVRVLGQYSETSVVARRGAAMPNCWTTAWRRTPPSSRFRN